MRARPRELHRQAERGEASAPQVLRGNVARLAVQVGTSEDDRRILEFVTLLHHEGVVLLDLRPEAVRAALSTQSVLVRSGLLSVDRSGTGLCGKLRLLARWLAFSAAA